MSSGASSAASKPRSIICTGSDSSGSPIPVPRDLPGDDDADVVGPGGGEPRLRIRPSIVRLWELPLKSATASTISCSSRERRLRMGCATDGCRGCGVPSSRAKNHGAAPPAARADWTRPRDTSRPPRPAAAERADVDVLDAVRREARRVLADGDAPADGAVDRRRGARHRWEGLAERCSSPGRAAFRRDSDRHSHCFARPSNPFRTRLPSWRPRSASVRCERELPRSARTTCGSRRGHL